MPRTEASSERTAAIAAKVIALNDVEMVEYARRLPADLRSLAASVLTQAQDHAVPQDEQP